jgi:hypothetical protein
MHPFDMGDRSACNLASPKPARASDMAPCARNFI